MELTKKVLEGKLETLQAQKEQALAAANACAGGIQIVQGLLIDLDRAEPTETEGADTSAPSEDEDV